MPLTRLATALCLLAGCRSGITAGPDHAYPCVPDAGSSASRCPFGSRCGLDAQCHPVGVASAYPCRADPDCEGGWRCGLDGRCHGREPAAYVCESDLDCEGGWRCGCCGEPRVCHSPAIGAAYRCRSTADCEQGWRCGLEGVCHDPAVGAAYACLTDQHCEADWRCGVSGQCVDWRAEALRLDTGPLEQQRLNPPMPGLPEQVSASEPGELGEPLQSFAFVIDGGLTHVVRMLDGGEAFAFAVPLDAGTPLAIASAGSRTFFLDAAGLAEHRGSRDGGAVRRIAGGAGAHALRLSISGGRITLLGLRDDGLWVYDSDTDSIGPVLPLRGEDGGAQTLFDAVAMPVTLDGTPQLLVAAEEGLFAAPLDGTGAFEPREVGDVHNSRCGPADGGRLLRVDRLDAEPGGFWLTFTGVARAPDGGEQAITQASAIWGACGAHAQGYEECPPCAAGESIADALYSPSQKSFLAWCRRGESVVLSDRCGVFHGLAPEAALTVERAVIGHGRQSHSVQGDSAGRLVDFTTPQTGEWWRARTVPALNRAPQALFKLGPRRWAAAGAEAPARFAVEQPGYGFVPAELPPVETPLLPAQSVATDLHWVFTTGAAGTRLFDLSTGAARLAATGDSSLGVPRHAVLAPSSDGGRWVVAAFGDRLAAANVTGEETTSLQVRLAPRVFDDLRSIAAVTPAAGIDGGRAPVVEGYALTGTALFHFTAQSELRWRADEVAAPAHAVAVWGEGGYGRLGFADGVIRSLPSRVVLARALPGDAGAVAAYAAPCGQPFALTAAGLFRLAPSDGGLAAWASEALPERVDPSGSFEGARLDVDGAELLVSTAVGNVVRLSPPLSCP